jgi:hypothetical protein
MEINNLIDAIQSGDVQDSNNAFNELMSDRINSALDSHKQDIAGKLYGTVDTEAEEDGDI